MGRWMKKIKNKQYGQAMVEFALTLPVFLLLIFGVIELSRFFLTYSSVFTASREASRFGSSVGQIGSENYLDCDGIAAMAVNTGWFGGVTELHSDPGEPDVVNIYYESSPGIVIGSCSKDIQTDSGVQTLLGYNLIKCDPSTGICDPATSFNPTLGDRVVVEIVSTYRPILGIVPEIPVRAVNGRTVMKAISIEKKPDPFELCIDHVSYVVDTPTAESGNLSVLYVSVENLESEVQDPDIPYQTSFSIFQIVDIDWLYTDSVNELPKLLEIRWGENTDDFSLAATIWKSTNIEGDIPVISIPGGENYWEEFSRNLPPNDTYKLYFVFSEDVDQGDINLSFNLIMRHNNLPTDFCWPVE